ncbi:MAG: outer membrane protein assembly factor BamE [Pseudomonadales bacterium]|nr:outer membrane protein assembly factor BamE [Pseudomonadales bacterium]MDP6469621.1 outer membrane protein assembly factor BamE [Pseudomonadales bacterium]MDP6973193.1 outer membrane protein assembly factor BamE [Pseudomonadales bacterium]
MLKNLILLAAALALAACSFSMPKLPKLSMPRVHKITIQQGNVITQDMIDRLKPGMTRSQVAFIMGEPIIRNTFNDDRWDYIYTVEVPGYFNNTQRMSIFFENEALSYFTGDYAPTGALEEEGEVARSEAEESGES